MKPYSAPYYWRAIVTEGYTLTTGAGLDWHNVLMDGTAASTYWIPYDMVTARGSFVGAQNTFALSQKTLWISFFRRVPGKLVYHVDVDTGSWQIRTNGVVEEFSSLSETREVQLKSGVNEICLTADTAHLLMSFYGELWDDPRDANPMSWWVPSAPATGLRRI